MSGIQILNTLPNYTNPNQFSNPLYRQNENGNIPHSVDNPYSSFHEANQNQWEVDLQDMSWLGRLPVYNDLEPGVQFNQWLGRFYSDVNML
jgi:hypothetical protein